MLLWDLGFLARGQQVHPIPPGGWVLSARRSAARDCAPSPNSRCLSFPGGVWALYYQTASAWVLQAEKMDLHFFGPGMAPRSVPGLNPIFVLTFIPLFSYVLYPAIDRVWKLTPLRKIGIGLFLTVVSFFLCLLGSSPH